MSHFENIFYENETYSLQLVTSWLKDHNIQFIYSSPIIEHMPLYQHGIKIIYKNTYISIQTHPAIAECAFAESLILNDYSEDAIKHETPNDLFVYIRSKLSDLNIERIPPPISGDNAASPIAVLPDSIDL